jgi:hypothetical protein
MKRLKDSLVVIIILCIALVVLIRCPSPIDQGNNGGGDTTAKSTDATLSNLTISDGQLSPAFDAQTTSYTVAEAASVASVTVTATTSSSKASLKINDKAVASGTPSEAVALTEGQTSTVTIVVTAEDGTTAKTYTVSITRAVALSNDATLSGLAVSSGQLSPGFDATKTAYTVSVSNTITSVTVTPTATSSKATVKVNGSAVTSGSASSPIPLTAGQTTAVGIVVTAEDGATTKTYTVSVTRATADSGVVAAPVFDPPAGTYTSGRSVTISSDTTGAEIYYTMDDSQPSEASTHYTGSVSVSASLILRAIAVNSGMISAFGRAEYLITGKVATPVISPATGTYPTAQEVTITCATSGADIHYRLDGGTPQITDPVYGGPFTISATSYVRAIAMKDGWTDSDMASSDITINLPVDKALPPTINPPGGLYYEDQTVTLEQNDAEYIYYTVDGSDPKTSGTKIEYTGSFSVTSTNTQIRAYAVDTGKTVQESDETSATYRLKCATPTATPDAGAEPIDSGTNVTLSCSTSSVTIQYNTSGADLTSDHTTYTGPFILNNPHLRAIAQKSGYEDSDLLIAEYCFQTPNIYTDGAGHIYRLVMNGADLDVTSSFDYPAAAMTFAQMGTFPAPTYYTSGGKVYQLALGGTDIDVTTGLENFTPTSPLFTIINGLNGLLLYRAGDKLYEYNSTGADSDVTPPYFTSSSEILYVFYSDGQGHVYGWSDHNPYTSLFQYLTSTSHLLFLGTQVGEPPYGYTANGKIYHLSGTGQDSEFDSSEFEHFTSQSVIHLLSELQ